MTPQGRGLSAKSSTKLLKKEEKDLLYIEEGPINYNRTNPSSKSKEKIIHRG